MFLMASGIDHTPQESHHDLLASQPLRNLFTIFWPFTVTFSICLLPIQQSLRILFQPALVILTHRFLLQNHAALLALQYPVGTSGPDLFKLVLAFTIRLPSLNWHHHSPSCFLRVLR